MIRLFTGRENIDKERFIYDRIREDAGETFVLVPDQYTLVAEEQALSYLGTDCLFDVEILSMNRLGLRILTEKGMESVRMLDKYGRFMLLSRLIKEHKDDFDIFRRSAGKLTFTTMLNDFISEFKQHNCTLEELDDMICSGGQQDDGDANATAPILRAKLGELKKVIEAYEEAISGRYKDSEDYIAAYVDAIRDSALVRGKSIWIYGYDTITPKFMNAMMELASAADSVSFIVNLSDFDLGDKLISMIRSEGSRRGIRVECEEIGIRYELPKSETIRRIESGLWNDTLTDAELDSNKSFIPEDLTLVSAANPYFEAESAASYVWHLVRDLGYRMSDIQIIANDEGMMQPVIRRVFDEYGLPVFLDASRNITDTPAAGFIVNLLWFTQYRGNSQYLFAMLKTGLSGIDPELTEELENYVRSYHIRGSMWDKPFRYGEEAVGTELFVSLNEARERISSAVRRLADLAAKGTVAGFVRSFRDYLEEEWQLGSAVEDSLNEIEALGFHEEAQRNIQSYHKALELLDQIVEIIGDTEIDLAEFTDIYVEGLTSVEVGVIPPAVDGLSVGTMIRTRPRPVRAAVILGANEGTLPLSPKPEGLFSVDEKEYFRSRGFALGALDDLRMTEENAAMYRILSLPSEKLYISWSLSDTEGKDMSPSPVIEQLTALFPMLAEDDMLCKDTVSAGWHSGAFTGSGSVSDLITSPEESMRHLVNRIKDKRITDKKDPLTLALMKWYKVNRGEDLEIMLNAAADQNAPDPLGRDIAKKLFARSDGSLVLSASSIGSYFDCPFRFYIDRGLRPREEREFTGDRRSIGDAYHECLMRVAHRIIDDRELLVRILDDDEALEKVVSEELAEIAEQYRGGVFVSAGNEEFRMSRIREICAGAVKAMASQLASDSVVTADFEESFSRRGKFEPVTLKIGEDTVYVEGKIDRSDVLDVGGGRRVRIIDYKTGSDKLDVWKLRNGYKMQLMIYMISASSGGMEPAGLFYFNIQDPIQSVNSGSANKMAEIMESEPGDYYKLKGKYIAEPGVLDSMPAEVLSSSKSSMTREEFEQAKQDVLTRIEETATGILRGAIDIQPLRNDKKLVCGSCGYKSICRRDGENRRNKWREIPPDPDKKKKKS